jgi:hypothetical protein
MFGDLGGGHFVLEGSAAFKSVRKAGDFGEGDFLHMRNNFFTAEGGKSNLADQPGKFYPHGGWVQDPPPGVTDPDAGADIQMASVRTNQTMYNMLSQYQGEVDLEFAKMLWRFAGKMPKDPWSIAEFRATKGRAWETPGNLNNVQVNICIPDNGANGKVYICAGPAGRVATPYNADPAASDWYQKGGTHTFYELTLAADPGAIVYEANASAHRDLGLAYQKLMHKNFGDVGFEGLNTLFDTANTEYYDGVNWTSKAGLASGNTKLLYYGQAATAFARAQAHAQQISETLVHPATTPSKLGLKPYRAVEYGF